MRILDNIDRSGNKIYKDLPDAIPNDILNKEWADKIHGQSLERLNERGGLSVIELIMNLKRLTMSDMYRIYGYNYKPTKKDADELLELLKQQTQWIKT